MLRGAYYYKCTPKYFRSSRITGLKQKTIARHANTSYAVAENECIVYHDDV